MKMSFAYLGATLMLTATGIMGPLDGASADTVLKLVTTKVSLPDPFRQYQGTDAAAINKNCLTCHSAGMVLNQPAMNQATWTVEVNKMINVFKGPIDKADVPAIIAYLVKHKGTK